jgi:hypothetical protein
MVQAVSSASCGVPAGSPVRKMASWYRLSIVQKKVISPSNFTSTNQLAATLLAFIDRYNQTARPFNWKFTAADLTRLVQRLSSRHEHASQPEAA